MIIVCCGPCVAEPSSKKQNVATEIDIVDEISVDAPLDEESEKEEEEKEKEKRSSCC